MHLTEVGRVLLLQFHVNPFERLDLLPQGLLLRRCTCTEPDLALAAEQVALAQAGELLTTSRQHYPPSPLLSAPPPFLVALPPIELCPDLYHETSRSLSHSNSSQRPSDRDCRMRFGADEHPRACLCAQNEGGQGRG